LTNPIATLLVGGLVVVAVAAVLSIVVWVWAVRRPMSASMGQAEESATNERAPLVYAAVGAQIGLGLDNGDDVDKNWVDLLRERMPEGTRLLLLGRRGITLGELNRVEIPAVVKARPDIVTLWNAVSDATGSVPLATHVNDLRRALTALTGGTRATILLLNLPDISLRAREVADEQRSLIRGGVEQWNRAIAGSAARYGKRVRLVDLYPISEQLLGRQADESRENSPLNKSNNLLADTVWATIDKERLLESI
jgi:hypothetical protein